MELGRGSTLVSCHYITNHSEAQWLKTTTIIFFLFNLQFGRDSSLLFATLSEVVGQPESLLPCCLVCMASKLVRLGNER